MSPRASASGKHLDLTFVVRYLCAAKEEGRMAVETSRDEFSEENLPPPTGTIFILGMYMLVLAVGWAVMFWTLLGR